MLVVLQVNTVVPVLLVIPAVGGVGCGLMVTGADAGEVQPFWSCTVKV